MPAHPTLASFAFLCQLCLPLRNVLYELWQHKFCYIRLGMCVATIYTATMSWQRCERSDLWPTVLRVKWPHCCWACCRALPHRLLVLLQVMRRIVDDRWPVKYPPYMSPQAKDLIMRLLERKPAKRIGMLQGRAADIKNHKWFAVSSGRQAGHTARCAVRRCIRHGVKRLRLLVLKPACVNAWPGACLQADIGDSHSCLLAAQVLSCMGCLQHRVCGESDGLGTC